MNTIAEGDGQDSSQGRPPSLASNFSAAIMSRRTSTVSTPSEGTSTGKTGGGLASFRRLSKRMSMWGALGKALSEKEKPKPAVPKVKMENTYRLEPDPSATFNTARVRRMMNNVLNAQLQGKDYDPKTTSMLASKISDTIKHKVKLMNFKRHKVVVYVTIGSTNRQGITVASLCLWDTKTDDFATATYENSSLFAIATAYATYYE